MSDESSPPQGARLRLRLRTDKPAGEVPSAPTEPPPPAAPVVGVPASPAEPVASAPPAVPGEPKVVDSARTAPAPIRLKPRITIKPSEPERPAETIFIPGLPSVLPPIGSNVPDPLGAAPEKIRIDIGTAGKPREPMAPAAPAPSPAPAAAEKGESTFKFKLKPAPFGDHAETPARPGVVETIPVEVAAVGSVAAGPSLPAAPVVKKMPTLRSTEPPQIPKQDRRPLLGFCLLLLMLAGACVYWFFFRTPSPAPAPARVVTSPAATPRPVAPVAVEAQPRPAEAVPPAAADHAMVSGETPAKPGTGAAAAAPAAAVPAATTAVTAPAPSATPAAVSLPPIAAPEPAGPSAQFRAFVDHLKINGVRTGPPARLFVDGVACRPGDALDRELGVIFVGVDSDSNEILFKDATGAIVRRRY